MSNLKHQWILIETSEGIRIVTERHADGTLSWQVNPTNFHDRYLQSKVISSTICQSRVRTISDITQFEVPCVENSASNEMSQNYAQHMYRFASGEVWQEPKDARGEIASVKSHADGNAFAFDLSQFASFEPSAIKVEIVEPVDSMYKRFGGRCLLLRNVLTPSETKYLIQDMDKHMERVRYRQDYRRNDRSIFESPELAELLWKRVQPFASGLSVIVDEDPSKQRLVSEDADHCPDQLRVGFGKEGVWHPVGLNECLRFCKYNVGDFFRKHCDQPFQRSEDEQSLFTCMFYLNGDFGGGSTRFLHFPENETATIESQFKLAHDAEVLASIEPEPGSCILFFQPGLWHEGADIHSGVKYILRSDVMYRRDPATKKQRTPKQAQAMELLQQAQAAEERRECDLACRLYRRAFKLDPDIEQMLR